MSLRELKALAIPDSQEVAAGSSRSGLVRGTSMETADAEQLGLEERLVQLEAELAGANSAIMKKDQDLENYRQELEEAKALATEAHHRAEQHSHALEERLGKEESLALRAEVEKLRALENLREEHRRAIEKERQQVEEWMHDVKERFKVEKQHFEERIASLERQLEEPRTRPGVGGDSDSDTHAMEMLWAELILAELLRILPRQVQRQTVPKVRKELLMTPLLGIVLRLKLTLQP